MATSSVAPQGDPRMQQSQASMVQQQPKLPFQLNALRPQDQQNQLLQFQQEQQQQQQMQGHFNLGGGANNGLHMLMHPAHGHTNMMDLRGNHPGTLEARSGNGQGKSGLGRDGRE